MDAAVRPYKGLTRKRGKGVRPLCNYNRELVTPALPTMDSAATTVFDVVQRARRRSLGHLALQDALEACSVALLGPAVLLVFGTDLVPEALLLLFVLAGLGFGTYRWLHARPSPYAVAQRLDASWETHDQISTAYYFSEHADRAGPLAKQQQGLAGPLASAGSVPIALPLEIPKAAYALAGMVVLIGGLFGLRYSMQATLSLKPPLPPMVMQALLGDRADDLFTDEETSEELAETSDETAASNREERELERDTREEQREPTPRMAGGDQPPEALAEDLMAVPEVEGLSVDEQYGDELASAEGAGRESGSEQEGLEADTDERSPGESSPQDPSRPNAGGQSEESDDLWSRLQDAFEKMLSSMNLEEQTSGESGEPSGGEESQQSSEAGAEAQASAGEGQEGRESDSQGQEGGGTPENPQELSQGEGGSEDSNLTPEGQATSSAGSNDGSKELAAAALDQALGELSELYSRRAEEMSGEVLIETEAGPQELQTPYSPSEAGHRDPGGVIRRDQIPHAYRHFIQKYFEALQEKN